MPDLNKIIEDLSSLTVAEAAELSKQLEEKWGVTPMAAAAPAAAGGAAPAEEKDDFTIMIVKSSFSSAGAAPPAAAGAAAAIGVTPHFSSNCFESSAASATVKLERSSIILLRSGILITLWVVFQNFLRSNYSFFPNVQVKC